MAYTHAWLSLTRLGGCNYKMAIQRRGRSVTVADPQQANRRYRIDAAKFDANEYQFRNDWTILPWTGRAADVTHEEMNWQT